MENLRSSNIEVKPVDADLDIRIGDPFTIASHPPTFAFPTLHALDGQRFMLAVWTAPDASLSEENQCQTAFWTQDGGKSWSEPVTMRARESGGHSFVHRKDGSCVWLSYFTQPVDARTVSCWVGRSEDGRQFAWSPGRVAFPDPVRIWEQGNAFMIFARSILELADGSLIATMYGYFEHDYPKFRSLLVRSTDGGASWDYRSTIAFDPAAPDEGYCEPVLVRAADGDLICVIRVGTALPMWICRSQDDGRTWTQPRELPEYATSVFPDATLMSNGVLAVSFGRPGAHIMFSVDGNGHRWTPRATLFDDPIDMEGTCAYTDIREVAPGRLLYVYSYLENHVTPGKDSHIRGVFVDVKRK